MWPQCEPWSNIYPSLCQWLFLLPLLNLEEPASVQGVRVPRAYAPRFPQPPGPIPRRPPGRRPRVQLRYSGAAGIAGPATRGGLRVDFMASPFRSVNGLWCPFRVTLASSSFQGPSPSPASPHPFESSPRVGLSFCVRGYQGPRGVSSAAGRQPALGAAVPPGSVPSPDAQHERTRPGRVRARLEPEPCIR